MLQDGISWKRMYGNVRSNCIAPADPQAQMGEMEQFSTAEGAAPSSRLSILCPVREVPCLAANQICVKWLMYIPGAERLSPADTWSQPSAMPPLDPGGSVEHQLTCPPAAHWHDSMLPLCRFLHMFPCTIVILLHALSSCVHHHPVWRDPWGFALANLPSTCSDSDMHRSVVSH